ncbi:hypothetical protein QQ020_04445 [Fulvivirgaceae bacterium BMA12]|uniref:Long-chain fatty acid transport protein n=1 Tax=Agaribacillus aureus TaxID=3051825 RepID=A0ABT8L0M2_9BACT|nr:hypothetical protein [Fulvivirgaceae bacterium BMA12]
MKYTNFPLLLVLIMISFISGIDTKAQSIAGSAYTVFGIGDLIPKQSAINKALGGSGIGLRSELYLNLQNPASLTAITSPVTQLFEMGAHVEFDRYKTMDAEETGSSGNLSNLNLWFRLSPRWAMAIGFAPYSKVDYDITTQRNLGALSTASIVNYQGSGGFNQVYLGNGFRVTKNLSIGFNSAFLFGSILKTEIVESLDLSNAFRVENQLFMNKVLFDFGAQYSVFLPKSTITIGTTFAYETAFSVTKDATLFESDLNTISGETTTEDNYRLPLTAGFGLSFNSAKSTISADVKYQNWSTTSFSEDTGFRDIYHYALGYEYKTNFSSDHNLNMVCFRSGIFYKDNYLDLADGTFAEWGFNVGIGIPVQGNKTTLNLNYSHLRRGTTNNGLIEESAGLINFDVVIRDAWFIRRKFN